MNPPSPWARTRAALLALAIALNLLLALPAPRTLPPQMMDTPTARDELRGWHALTQRLGLDWTEDQLADQTLLWTNRWAALRRAVIGAPTRPLRRYLGIRQGWALFARPDSRPTLLAIEIRTESGGWTPVYRSQDPDLNLGARQIEYRRTRGVLDGATRPHRPYRNLCRWLAGEVFDQRPDAWRVRIRTVQLHVARPGEPVDAMPRQLHVVAFDRTDVRP